jgi:hypothetical protein
VPTLVIDGASHVLQHPSQAALLLGFEAPPALRDAWQVAWDVDAILAPVEELGRTPLALTVDALVGIAALTDALATGWFHWPGNPVTGELGDASVVAYEASIVATIATRADLLAFARPIAGAWREAVLARDDELRREPDRAMRSPRGDLTLVELLEAQRLHAAQHYRQATSALDVPTLDLLSLYGLRLPRSISG